MTIFLFAIAEAAAKSRGDGKSPKLVNSDHCHISETQLNITYTQPIKRIKCLKAFLC